LKAVCLKILDFIFKRQKSLPVLCGPLFKKLLPKTVALNNPGMLLGRYEAKVLRELYAFAGSIKVAYDVGANVGYVSLALADLVGEGGRVFSFEPEPENRALMEQVISVNRAEKIIQIVPLAVGNSIGPQRFIRWKASSMNLLEMAIDGQDVSACESSIVQSTTLDAFIFENNNPPPDLAKIDVEGAEGLVLDGGLMTIKRYSPVILIEVHGPNSAKKVWNFMKECQYFCWHISQNGRLPISSLEKCLSLFSKETWTQHFLLIRSS
jgi:FkbM family methyltransferase